MGLASFYNQVIDGVNNNAIIVFIHDDVFVHDWNLAARLERALDVFDVVGVVGATGVPYGQPGWWYALDAEARPRRNDAVSRSGSINHFDPVFVRPDFYGPVPMACDLLDGVFLAVRAEILRASGVRFDPQFTFHCYDTDFCYTARAQGLRLGTWPIALTHGSAGSFGSSWISAAQQLQLKLAQVAP